VGRLDGKVALVTGGARGIGGALVEGLVREGVRVMAADVLEEEGQRLVGRLDGAAAFVRLDVTSDADWRAAIDETQQRFGALDILVNNAGILAYGLIEEMEPEDFRRVLDVNLFGTFLGMHHAIPAMRATGAGLIVNVSSTAGMMGYAQIGAYVASKWGVRGLTKTAALELGRDNIRVVSVHPGPITTKMTAALDDTTTRAQPIPRFGTTDEVTSLVLFLAADATYCTGAEFVVDGGALLGPVIDLTALAE
jgi:3alpha(or 20beta)-hydroxysteroid dehydrogenase